MSEESTSPLSRTPRAGRRSLTAGDLETYAWQLPVEGFGEVGQERLKASSVLVTRCGGLGGVVAYELAAAGVGRLILAHGGNLRADDLNRQILMTRDWIGRPRVECAARRLREFNPGIEIVAVPSNVTTENVAGLVAQADVVVDCAPLFEERYLLNQEIIRQNKPMVECAVYALEAHLTTLIPGETPCLRCLYPEPSAVWTRRFPVFGAVPACVGGMAAMEVVKILAGFGEILGGVLLAGDLGRMRFRRYRVRRDPECRDCGSARGLVSS